MTSAPIVRWTVKKENFVRAYLETGNGAEACRRAGYSRIRAKEVAWRLLHQDRLVMAAIEEGRQALQAQHEIRLEDMIRQLSEDREFARQTNSAVAAVRASELLCKLGGLLIDRVDQRTIGGIKIELVSYDGASAV